MIPTNFSQLRLPACILLATLLAGCGEKRDLPPAPETAEPAPAAAVTPAEDRGQEKSGETAAPASDQHAFSNVESGEAERAASKRGHESAGETAPAASPGSGG
jgi:hypothetical protein